MSAVEYVGELRLEYADHLGETTRQMTQPSERHILEHTQELRRNPGVLNDLSFGRCQLIIPEVVMEELRRRNPELQAGADNESRTRWWQRFARSSASRPYRVR